MHGYHVALELRNQRNSIWSQQFREVYCKQENKGILIETYPIKSKVIFASKYLLLCCKISIIMSNIIRKCCYFDRQWICSIWTNSWRQQFWAFACEQKIDLPVEDRSVSRSNKGYHTYWHLCKSVTYLMINNYIITREKQDCNDTTVPFANFINSFHSYIWVYSMRMKYFLQRFYW